MLKAALCDNLRIYLVFSTPWLFFSVFRQQHCLYLYYQHWGALYGNNRWSRIYKRTCFSHITSQFGEKRIVSTDPAFPQNIFLQCLPLCFCHYDLITHLPSLHWKTFTGVFMCRLSFVTFLQFAVFCLTTPSLLIHIFVHSHTYFAKLQVFVIPVKHVCFSSFTDGQFPYWA